MRISELIIRFIDWFYRKPVAAILPRQTFRYVVCGGANVAFSWVCYFLVYNFVLDKEQDWTSVSWLFLRMSRRCC